MVQPTPGFPPAPGEEAIDLESSEHRPLLRARQRHTGDTGGSTGGLVYTYLPGAHADFW